VDGIILTSSVPGKDIQFSELKLKDYKILLKCLFGSEIDSKLLLDNINNIIAKISNLKIDDIRNLNIIEYFLLLTEIRINSLGGIINAVYNDTDLKKNLEIPLIPVITNLTDFLQHSYNNKFVFEDNEIHFEIPKIANFNEDDFCFINSPVPIDDLPAKFLPEIVQNINALKGSINSIYFYETPLEQFNINFTCSFKHYLLLIKLLFNESLFSIYENTFYLCKLCNFSAEFLDNCTYGEFNIFVKKAENILKQSNNSASSVPHDLQSSGLDNDNVFDPVDINSLYNNPDIKITPSEFTP
jgi:hypothetical protein